jgi:hypothetical protein
MPSTSKKQHNFMAAVANNPAFAKKAGVPQSVGKDFSNADKGKTFKRGGDMAKANPFMEMIAKKKEMAAGKKSVMPSKMGKPVMKKGMDTAKDGMKKMAAGGMAYAKGGGIESKGKTKGKMVTMKSGGGAKKYC